jgi:hypothetical protein
MAGGVGGGGLVAGPPAHRAVDRRRASGLGGKGGFDPGPGWVGRVHFGRGSCAELVRYAL